MEFHGGRSTYKPDNLASTGYVYVRHDAHCGPLQRPYDGPFKILEVHEKYYVLDMNGRHDSVSINRLKTAYGKQTYCQPALVPPQPVSSSHPTRAALSPPATSMPQPTVHSRLGKPIKTPVPLPVGLGSHSVPHWGGPCGGTLQNIINIIMWLMVCLSILSSFCLC